MTAPDFARLEALPLPTLSRLDVQGQGHGQTCRAVCAGLDACYFLPPAVSPALLPLPSGAALLFLPDWTGPESDAYRVPAHLLPDVRRALDLRPAFSLPDVGA